PRLVVREENVGSVVLLYALAKTVDRVRRGPRLLHPPAPVVRVRDARARGQVTGVVIGEASRGRPGKVGEPMAGCRVGVGRARGVDRRVGAVAVRVVREALRLAGGESGAEQAVETVVAKCLGEIRIRA